MNAQALRPTARSSARSTVRPTVEEPCTQREEKGIDLADQTRPEVIYGETSHHVVQLGDAAGSIDEMMRSALESIEHLDFEPEMRCEQDPCRTRAAWRLHAVCPKCAVDDLFLLCDAHRQQAWDLGLWCGDCNHRGPMATFLISLGPLR